MDLTDRISFSNSFDLAGQEEVLKDPGQVYIAKTINICRFVDRFLVDFGILWGSFGDDLSMFWVVPRHVLDRKIDLYKFSKDRFFEDRCIVCSLKLQGTWSGSGPKINFDKNVGSGLAGPDKGLSSAGNPLCNRFWNLST